MHSDNIFAKEWWWWFQCSSSSCRSQENNGLHLLLPFLFLNRNLQFVPIIVLTYNLQGKIKKEGKKVV
jgi:hypothetical protein